jgi:hypothetical protein
MLLIFVRIQILCKFEFCSKLEICFKFEICAKFEICSKFEICFKFEICSKFEFCSNLKFIRISCLKYIYAHSKFIWTEKRKRLPIRPNWLGPSGGCSQAGANRSRNEREIAAPERGYLRLKARPRVGWPICSLYRQPSFRFAQIRFAPFLLLKMSRFK